MQRLRTPLAIAASVVGALVLLPLWQQQERKAASNYEVLETGMIEEAVPAVPAAPAPAPEAPPKPQADPPEDKRGIAVAQREKKPVMADVQAEPAPAPVVTDSYSRAPATANYGATAPQARAAGNLTHDAAPEQIMAAPPAPAAPAPTLAKAAVGTIDPASRLEAILALLRNGKRDEAAAAWRTFRADYPDYVVPEAQATRLKALQE